MRWLQEMLPYDPQYDVAGTPWGDIDDIVWRRSALQFLLEVMAPSGTDPSKPVLGDLARELEKLDANLREEIDLAPMPTAPPAWVVPPQSHWWWRHEEEAPP